MSSDAEFLLVEILTPARLQSIFLATNQNISSAIELYNWNGQLAAEFFQILGQVEIAVRNSIDRELQALNVTLGNDTSWPNALRFAFPHSPSRQPEYIFTRVRHLHVLRNRIAHHEPIHNRDLARDYQICMDVLSAISPIIAEWSAENSRVMQVLARRPM